MLRVMVIGVGYWGPNLVRAITAARGAQLVAVSDFLEANLSKVRESLPGVVATTDFAAHLASVDAVVIATPPTTHFDIAQACLLAGKHVYIEKPITPGVAQAAELGRLSEASGLTLMVGHIYQYAPVVERMSDVVASGEIGEVLYSSSVRANMGRFSDRANVVWDLLPHDLCVLKRVLGVEVAEVSCQAMSIMTPGIEDVAYTMLGLTDGTQCHVHDSWFEPVKTRRFSLVGTKASIVLDEGQGVTLTIYDKGAHRTAVGFEYFDNGARVVDFPRDEPLVVECQHFVDCALGGGRPRTDVDDAIRVLQTIEAVQRSLTARGAWQQVSRA